MTSPKPRPLWPILTAALIGLPVLYLLSIGPLCWLGENGVLSGGLAEMIHCMYVPLEHSYEHGPDWWKKLIDVYVDLWIALPGKP